MLPKADIVAWRRFAPWINDAQVEQDLIISRALVAFSEMYLQEITQQPEDTEILASLTTLKEFGG